jgi:hypothetical protein
MVLADCCIGNHAAVNYCELFFPAGMYSGPFRLAIQQQLRQQRQQQQQQQPPQNSTGDAAAVLAFLEDLRSMDGFIAEQLLACRDSDRPFPDDFASKLTVAYVAHAQHAQQVSSSSSSSSSSSIFISDRPIAGPRFAVSSSSSWFGKFAGTLNASEGLQQLQMRDLVLDVGTAAMRATRELQCSTATVQRCREVVVAMLAAAGDAVQQLLQQQQLTVLMLDAVCKLAREAEVYAVCHTIADGRKADKSGSRDRIAIMEEVLQIVQPCFHSSSSSSSFSIGLSDQQVEDALKEFQALGIDVATDNSSSSSSSSSSSTRAAANSAAAPSSTSEAVSGEIMRYLFCPLVSPQEMPEVRAPVGRS